MPTWSTRYVRLNDRGADPAALRAKAGGEVHTDPGSSFAAITVTQPALQPDDLGELSREFGEALSVQVHSVADLIVYDHFQNGARTRGLTYAGEAGWIRVVGTPESWEAPLFFGDDKLRQLLVELEEDCTDEAILARDTAELQRLFAAAKLEEGNARPAPQWPALSQAIERHYGLPEAATRQSTKLPKSAPKG
jgi:hypothetical protein